MEHLPTTSLAHRVLISLHLLLGPCFGSPRLGPKPEFTEKGALPPGPHAETTPPTTAPSCSPNEVCFYSFSRHFTLVPCKGVNFSQNKDSAFALTSENLGPGPHSATEELFSLVRSLTPLTSYSPARFILCCDVTVTGEGALM